MSTTSRAFSRLESVDGIFLRREQGIQLLLEDLYGIDRERQTMDGFGEGLDDIKRPRLTRL